MAPLRRTIDELICPDFALIVAHTHTHRDHTAADAQFAGRSNTMIVGHSVADVGRFFEITDWPGRDYPLASTFQPHEALLPMTVTQLVEVRHCARRVASRRGAHQFNDFAIFNGPRRAAIVRQMARAFTVSALGAFRGASRP